MVSFFTEKCWDVFVFWFGTLCSGVFWIHQNKVIFQGAVPDIQSMFQNIFKVCLRSGLDIRDHAQVPSVSRTGAWILLIVYRVYILLHILYWLFIWGGGGNIFWSFVYVIDTGHISCPMNKISEFAFKKKNYIFLNYELLHYSVGVKFQCFIMYALLPIKLLFLSLVEFIEYF